MLPVFKFNGGNDMTKVIDITDKLDFDGNPKIRIKDTEIEVNSDAATMLKVMGVLGEKENPGPKEVIRMYELMFSEKERKKIDEMKLSFLGFQTIIFEAINLITGEEQGEQ